jgi:single-strand DNA-binding protein
MDLNRAMIIGNLTRDPEMRTIPSGQSVANFSMATNRAWTGKDGKKETAVEYHNIVVWGKLAEICGQYLKKGQKTYIEGRLQTRDWEGQDGVKRSRTEIVAENMIMLSSGKGAGAPAGTVQSQSQAPVSHEPETEQLPEIQVPSRDEEIKVEDIPF